MLKYPQLLRASALFWTSLRRSPRPLIGPCSRTNHGSVVDFFTNFRPCQFKQLQALDSSNENILFHRFAHIFLSMFSIVVRLIVSRLGDVICYQKLLWVGKYILVMIYFHWWPIAKDEQRTTSAGSVNLLHILRRQSTGQYNRESSWIDLKIPSYLEVWVKKTITNGSRFVLVPCMQVLIVWVLTTRVQVHCLRVWVLQICTRVLLEHEYQVLQLC